MPRHNQPYADTEQPVLVIGARIRSPHLPAIASGEGGLPARVLREHRDVEQADEWVLLERQAFRRAVDTLTSQARLILNAPHASYTVGDGRVVIVSRNGYRYGRA